MSFSTLPLFHRVAGQPVIVLGDGEAAEARRRLVERAGGIVTTDEAADVRIAFVAIDDPAPVVERLRARSILINVPDRPEFCDFIVPAVLDRAPVLVAIGTGGASSGLAKALRLRLEALLPPRLGDLATGLAAARAAIRARWPGSGERRNAIDTALDSGGPLDPLVEGAAARIDQWLQGGDNASVGAHTVEIRLRSNDPDDLSLREIRHMGRADAIAFEPGVPAAVLLRGRADAARVPINQGADCRRENGLTIILRQRQQLTPEQG